MSLSKTRLVLVYLRSYARGGDLHLSVSGLHTLAPMPIAAVASWGLLGQMRAQFTTQGGFHQPLHQRGQHPIAAAQRLAQKQYPHGLLPEGLMVELVLVVLHRSGVEVRNFGPDTLY